MTTLIAFLVGVLILVTVHEFGHYAVARWCGVAVRRFSIGFGAPIWRWQRDASSTEFVIARWPLGGYVRMLDEADGQVPEAMLPFAFNRQSVARRLAIVVAGPMANVLLAIALYSGVQWLGTERPQPVLSTPVPGSLAERAGLRAGDRVKSLRIFEQANAQPVTTFDELWWELTQAFADREPVVLKVTRAGEAGDAEITLDFALSVNGTPEDLGLREFGFTGVWVSPTIKSAVAGGAADRAGVQSGDLVLAINGERIEDAQALRLKIQDAVLADGSVTTQQWQLERNGQIVVLELTPDVVDATDRRVGRAGVMLGGAPATVWVQAGFLEGLALGATHTWDVTARSVKSLWQMLVGAGSTAQLSGPVGVAKAAGQSASLGLTTYLQFLAFFSVSLAVINALPIPVLDGGHVMYYLWEWVSGRPPSPEWMLQSQRVGLALIATLMVVAVSNDLVRLWG